jgi:hypothetical protein
MQRQLRRRMHADARTHDATQRIAPDPVASSRRLLHRTPRAQRPHEWPLRVHLSNPESLVGETLRS